MGPLDLDQIIRGRVLFAEVDDDLVRSRFAETGFVFLAVEGEVNLPVMVLGLADLQDRFLNLVLGTVFRRLSGG
jgi:hypothetical protein